MGGDKEEGEVSEDDLLAAGPHPLKPWRLFFDGALQSGKRGGTNAWANNLKVIAEFNSIEEFWGIVNNIPAPSKLPVGYNYHLFREGIVPMWEDSHNSLGGKWVYTEKRSGGVSCKALDAMWLHTMLCCIGENFPDGDQICGAVCSLRAKQDRVAIWTKDANDDEAIKPIGNVFRKVLSDAVGEIGAKPISDRDLEYSPHDESLKKLGGPGGKRR